MTVRLNPYLHFDGDARAAMEFYRDVLGGELSVMTFGEMGMEGDKADQVMHAMLTTPDGFALMAADTPPDMPLQPGNSVQISLSGDDARLRDWFDALCEGGEVHVPLEKQMWGDEFGQCADRFGITWLVNIGAPA